MQVTEALRRWYDGLFEVDPWTWAYAVGRSLIGLSPLLTLVANPGWLLFAPAAGREPPNCLGLVSQLGMFCLMPPTVGRLIGIAVLLAAVIGWRPRWTAIPHAWVAFSLHNSITLVEGGDQIAANLAILLIPVALLDGRRWHWPVAGSLNGGLGAGDTGRMVANTTWLLIRIQVCVLYLHAAIGKLSVPEWLDGTAIYYWVGNPLLPVAGVTASIVHPISANALGATALSWGTILLELALAFGLVASSTARRGLLWAGIALHGGIALVFGLVTFGVAMAGALVLYLWPKDVPMTALQSALAKILGATRWRAGRKPGGEPDRRSAETDDHESEPVAPAVYEFMT